jgi:hypothetical protein
MQANHNAGSEGAPNMDGQTEHYMALQRTDRYLAIDQLEDGCLYLIHARNSHIGHWVAAKSGFVILREKFGERYLFTEYHWDRDESGTAKPLVKLTGPVAADTLRAVLEERLREIPYAVFMERTRSFIA